MHQDSRNPQKISFANNSLYTLFTQEMICQFITTNSLVSMHLAILIFAPQIYCNICSYSDSFTLRFIANLTTLNFWYISIATYIAINNCMKVVTYELAIMKCLASIIKC